MPITPNNPFKGRQHAGEVIILCVRWYLRYPLSYEHVAELVAERGVEVDASCLWRWVQAYAPELNKRCVPLLKPVHKSSIPPGKRSTFCSPHDATLPQPNAFCAGLSTHLAMACRG